MQAITVTVPGERFAVGDAMAGRPDLEGSLEAAALPGRGPTTIASIDGPGAADLREAIAARSAVERVEVVDRGTPARYRITWAGDGDGFVGRLLDHDAVLRGGRGTHRAWTFELRFPDPDAVSSFYRSCRSEGLRVEVEGVRRATGEGSPEFGLTSGQREILVSACEEGYFEVPRETTVEQLASEEGVSDQAVSARLRRAANTLVRNALARPD